MRVDEVFKQAASQGTAPISFEMFPPKGELTLDTAREVAGNLCKLSPSFVSVTCSAGGSGNGATTAPIAHMITSEFDTPSVAHLTCVGRSHADIAAKIDEYRTAGVENILALRGDLPAGATEDDKPASDYAYARDLIPELVDAGFCVGAAAYPEGHIACEDLNLSVEHLKQKQDAGASFFVTQLFFDNECFYRFRELADKVGITPWEIRYRNAIRPGQELPNGQIVGPETGLVETLEAVKPYYDEAMKQGKPVGIACAMKNAGVGVGLPDYGRCKLVIGDDGKVHIRAGASCIGQGLGTVLVQLVVTNAKLTRDQVVYDGNSTFITPDSGDTSGSRQTLVTGEACRRACLLLRDAMEYRSLSDLKGQEFYGEYYAKTNPLGANVPNPVSHVAYGYATQMCILDKETGKIKKMVAAHDVGKAINPLSCEGQIEGGVVMSMGYALTEQYPLDHGKPTAKYGTLGLFRSHQIPEIKAIVIDKPGLNLANGAIGIGEITSIPTAPAIAQAYYRYDGERRRSLPLDHTPYKK